MALLFGNASAQVCMPGGGECPSLSTGEHRHCGYYYDSADINTFNQMDTLELQRNSQQMCVRESECNTPVEYNASGKGIFYWCPNAECPPYESMDQQLRRCTQPYCPQNQIINILGQCQSCPPSYIPDVNRRNCNPQQVIRVTCGPTEQITSNGQMCYPCPPYTRGQQGNSICAPNQCYAGQFVNIDGLCQLCPSGTVPDPANQNRTCVRIVVDCTGPRTVYSPDRSSCRQCPEYERAQQNNQFCGSNQCSFNQVITREGTCSFCPPYSAVSQDQRSCGPPRCTGRDIITASGQCRACSPYTRPILPDRRTCGQDNCPPNSKLTQEGLCEACPSGTSVSGDMRFCTINVQDRTPTSSDRIKDVQFLSISPLDRLLNQRDRNDEIRVVVGCQGGQSRRGSDTQEYDFDLSRERINRLTCFDGSTPKAGESCKVQNDEFTQCGPGQPYNIELFDLKLQEIQGLSSPPSIGSFTVTKEMMECMVDDKLQIHFEFGKRQELAGAVACFDHVPYIRPTKRSNKEQSVEDEIPFTMLNICHKNSVSRRRCFLYAYQITIYVRDSERNSIFPLIEPKVFVKMNFNGIKEKLIVLPGDQTRIKFVTSYSDQEAVRIMPEIHSPSLPEPFKTRYHVNQNFDNRGGFNVRLPCDSFKVADTLQCQQFVAHCSDPNDKISFSIVGSGDMFLIEAKCSEFFEGFLDWEKIKYLLEEDAVKFTETFSEPNGSLKTFKVNKVTFINKWGVEQTEEGWFDFDYQVSWKWHSNEPKCFAGDHLTKPTPQCSYQCTEKQCLLKSPGGVNKDNRRVLEEDQSLSAGRQLQVLAGTDIASSEYVSATLPLNIPTRKIGQGGYKVPDRLMNYYLSNYETQSGPVRTSLVETSVFEEEAEPISLSSIFEENLGSQYTYNVTDKAKIDSEPATTFQITQVPQKGKMVTTNDGKVQQVHVGDLVELKSLDSITYDQGAELCSSKNKEECLDTFAFVPLSSWVGKGLESETFITLKPLDGRDPQKPLNDVIDTNTQREILPESNEEITPVKDSDRCETVFPNDLITFLVILIISLMGTGLGTVYYLFYSKSKGIISNKRETPTKEQDMDNSNLSPETDFNQLHINAQHHSQQSQLPFNQYNEESLKAQQFNSQNPLKNQNNQMRNQSASDLQSPDKLLSQPQNHVENESQGQNQHCNDYSIQLSVSKFNDQKSELSPREMAKNQSGKVLLQPVVSEYKQNYISYEE